MTETGIMDPAPTPTALAAKAFMERIDNPSFLQTIESRALNGGWVGSREAGCWDTHVCDSIAKAAVGAVMDLFRQWAAECDEHPPSGPAAKPAARTVPPGSPPVPTPPR